MVDILANVNLVTLLLKVMVKWVTVSTVTNVHLENTTVPRKPMESVLILIHLKMDISVTVLKDTHFIQVGYTILYKILYNNLGSPKGECRDNDECKTFICPTNAHCNNLVPSFECECDLGFQQNGLLPPGGVSLNSSNLIKSPFQIMIPKVLVWAQV